MAAAGGVRQGLGAEPRVDTSCPRARIAGQQTAHRRPAYVDRAGIPVDTLEEGGRGGSSVDSPGHRDRCVLTSATTSSCGIHRCRQQQPPPPHAPRRCCAPLPPRRPLRAGSTAATASSSASVLSLQVIEVGALLPLRPPLRAGSIHGPSAAAAIASRSSSVLSRPRPRAWVREETPALPGCSRRQRARGRRRCWLVEGSWFEATTGRLLDRRRQIRQMHIEARIGPLDVALSPAPSAPVPRPRSLRHGHPRRRAPRPRGSPSWIVSVCGAHA